MEGGTTLVVVVVQQLLLSSVRLCEVKPTGRSIASKQHQYGNIWHRRQQTGLEPNKYQLGDNHCNSRIQDQQSTGSNGDSSSGGGCISWRED